MKKTLSRFIKWSSKQKSVSYFIPEWLYEIDNRGQCYNHLTMVNYSCSIVNKLGASLTDDARVVIYNRHMFIVNATGVNHVQLFGIKLLTLFVSSIF